MIICIPTIEIITAIILPGSGKNCIKPIRILIIITIEEPILGIKFKRNAKTPHIGAKSRSMIDRDSHTRIPVPVLIINLRIRYFTTLPVILFRTPLILIPFSFLKAKIIFFGEKGFSNSIKIRKIIIKSPELAKLTSELEKLPKYLRIVPVHSISSKKLYETPVLF